MFVTERIVHSVFAQQPAGEIGILDARQPDGGTAPLSVPRTV
jgi:hypothetical protein